MGKRRGKCGILIRALAKALSVQAACEVAFLSTSQEKKEEVTQTRDKDGQGCSCSTSIAIDPRRVNTGQKKHNMVLNSLPGKGDHPQEVTNTHTHPTFISGLPVCLLPSAC